jgi:hypothetical protein
VNRWHQAVRDLLDEIGTASRICWAALIHTAKSGRRR